MPVLIAVLLPQVLRRAFPNEYQYRYLLYAACGLFFVSWYLPSFLIDGQDTSFVTHFIGGGVFTGFLWVYLKKSLNWKSQWFIEAFSLFALVSALGCINELAELILVRTHVATILLSDTSWDIVANTAGAGIVFVFYTVYKTLSAGFYDRRR